MDPRSHEGCRVLDEATESRSVGPVGGRGRRADGRNVEAGGRRNAPHRHDGVALRQDVQRIHDRDGRVERGDLIGGASCEPLRRAGPDQV